MGVRIIPDLPDLRDEIARHAVVVLPFVSGGGIKNKLLEAASLGRPIVGSATAMNGLNPPEQLPWVRADGESAWVRGILDLWRDPEQAAPSGSAGSRLGDPEPFLGHGGAALAGLERPAERLEA